MEPVCVQLHDRQSQVKYPFCLSFRAGIVVNGVNSVSKFVIVLLVFLLVFRMG